MLESTLTTVVTTPAGLTVMVLSELPVRTKSAFAVAFTVLLDETPVMVFDPPVMVKVSLSELPVSVPPAAPPMRLSTFVCNHRDNVDVTLWVLSEVRQIGRAHV